MNHRLRGFVKRNLTGMGRTRTGLPSPISSEVVAEAVVVATGAEPVNFQYQTLSAGPTGEQTFRLIAALGGQAEVSLIYTLSPLERAPASALDAAILASTGEFEMTEGLILSAAAGSALARFVPHVLIMETTGDALHYVAEDVSGKPPADEELVSVAEQLPALHAALKAWSDREQPVLADRVRQYFTAVAPAMRDILRNGVAGPAGQSAGVLVRRWQEVVDAHERLADAGDSQPLHGDFHRWNILWGPSQEDMIVLDWDAVARGSPYIDLATLLIDEGPGLQQRAISAFEAASHPSGLADDNHGQYLGARLHVSLLWACLFATAYPRPIKRAQVRSYLEEVIRTLDLLAP